MIAIETTTLVYQGEPAYVARVRLRGQRRVLWQRALGALPIDGPGTGDEMDRILADPTGLAAAEAAF